MPSSIAAVLHKLAIDAGLHDPQAVTDRLMLVVNGLRASGAAVGTPAVTTAVSLAKEIVRSASPPDNTTNRGETPGGGLQAFPPQGHPATPMILMPTRSE